MIENLKKRIVELEGSVEALMKERDRFRQDIEQWRIRAEAFEKDCERLKEEKHRQQLTIQSFADERFNYQNKIARLKEQLASEKEENDLIVLKNALFKDIADKLDKHGHVTIRYK